MNIIKTCNLDSATFYTNNIILSTAKDIEDGRIRDITYFTEDEILELLKHVPEDKWSEIASKGLWLKR